MTAQRHRRHIFETANGYCGIAWTDAGISRFQLPASTMDATERNMRKRVPDSVSGMPPETVARVTASARRYFNGENIDFQDVQLDLDGQDDFFRAIYAALRRVAWGQTTTYGALAKDLGAGPQAARDVGQAMARNPVPLLIPCHRVLAAGGKPGGFSAPGGTTSKIRMLELEGIHFSAPEPAQQALLF